MHSFVFLCEIYSKFNVDSREWIRINKSKNSDDIKIVHAHITIEKCNKISSRAYFLLTRAITLFRISIFFGLIESKVIVMNII